MLGARVIMMDGLFLCGGHSLVVGYRSGEMW